MERLKEKIMDFIEENPKVREFIQDNSILLKRIVLVAAMAFVAFAAFAFTGSSDGTEIVKEEEADKAQLAAETSIYVDIGGAVKNPMLAELPQGSRVEDAIVAAGGITQDADLSSINRADFLEDGQKVYIPSFGPDGQSASAGPVDSSIQTAGQNGSAGGKVNINTADSAALQSINGIGPATAEKIIDYRNSNGRFSKPEELMNVSGIGEKTFEKMKDYITI